MEGYFDSLDNITAVTDNNGNTVSYTYDYLGQLVGETNANGSYTVTYDERGNITQKDGINYIYGNSSWQDQLTNYNGTAITYDAIGNPNNWRDNMSLHWTNGRQLYYAHNGRSDGWYKYDSSGIRTEKTADAILYEFTYVDGDLIHQTDGTNTWWFYYDHTGKLVAMDYNGTLYYYMYDSIGNIFGLVDANGTFVANYTYDAWGKILSATGSMAEINPIRYKGYYYDTETGYYYLMSRYYDPVVGRFLNADGFAGTGQGVLGHNMYAYCGNNPLNRVDPTGQFWQHTADIFDGLVKSITYIANRIINTIAEAMPETKTSNKIINDQDGVTGEKFSYGFFSASWNGCEAIAVHNAMVLMGKNSDLADRVSDFQMVGGMWLYGLFGSNPYSVGDVLTKNGIKYMSISSVDDIWYSGTYIISYWNSDSIFDGLHTIAVTYDGVKYTAYNLKGDGKEYPINPSKYKDRYICGYFLGYGG